MNLTFLNPFLLFGMAAVGLPILIHRIAQKRPAVKKFSAVRLLLQSQQITARPRRLKDLLLLALRILAVATIVCMMARPVLVRPGSAALLREGAMVLILDNSLSMGFREDMGTRFEIAKKAAAAALEGFRGQVSLIPTVNAPGGTDFQWMKPQQALKELEALPLSFGRGNAASALTTAYEQLRGLKVPQQILILSDMAHRDWEGFDLSRLGIIPDAGVIFLRVGAAGRDANFCIKAVRLADGEIVAGVPARLEVRVSNLSDRAGTRQVQIRLSDRKIDQKTIDLKAGQEAAVFFELLVEQSGWINAAVTLTPDRLPADDVFYFPLKVAKKVNVLVVDGDPKISLKASESYFLVSALRPGASERSPFMTRVITAEEMARVDLQPYDTIFLLNVARPDFSRLATLLEMGRPVFFFLGDRVVPEAYNRFSLAPWQIRALTRLGESAQKIMLANSHAGTYGDLSHLAGPLKNASVRTYYNIEGTAQNLLSLRNHDPLLLAADAGRSKLFMFASSADLDWNDLALNAAYLPLLQGLVKEALGLTGTSLPAGITIGDGFGEKGLPVQITGTEGGPGIFQFRLPGGELRQGMNPPYEESDLAKVSEDMLKKKFATTDISVLPYQQGGLREHQGGRKELWPALLGILLAVLALETILANGLPRFRTHVFSEA